MVEKESPSKKKTPAEKPHTTIYHPITRDPYIIVANNEVDLENKVVKKQREWQDEIDKQNAKEAEEKYKRAGHREAHAKTEEERKRIIELNSLCFSRLHVISSESYISENVSASVKPPRKVYYPSLAECQKSLGLRTFHHAIHHFFQNAFAERYQKAQERYEKECKEMDERQEQIDRDYNQKKAEKTAEYKSVVLHMKDAEPDYVCEYFIYALREDHYWLKRGVQYNSSVQLMKYYPENQHLSFAYKIPNLDDIDLVERFSYDEKDDDFKTQEYSRVEMSKIAIGIADALLLRAIATVFRSDEYSLVESIQIVGFLEYLDDSCGKYSCKPAIIAQVNRDQFEQINLEQVNPRAFFERRAEAKYAEGLYDKPSYSISALTWERPD